MLELVRARGFASFGELAEALAVSESTVRRDGDRLAEQGSANRIHGGLIYAGAAPKLAHFDAQHPLNRDCKQAIARQTVRLIDDGDTVLLDGGSTTYEVARLLVGRPIHVVTNSLPVANLFVADSASDLVMIGGNLCPRTGISQGPYAGTMISTLRVRKTVFSVAGITEEGFFNNNLLVVEIERAMMKAADEVIVVADSSKFGRRSLTHLCGLSDISHLVVDQGIPPQWRDRIAAAGVNLVIAALPENERT
jgi:DeoR/GlpR family transcriptional regulator of sugar metabolism